MIADFLVVGSGLTGAVIARELADAGRSVVVLERRRHIGGNVFDRLHGSGIRLHAYGPHYFRTNDEALWRYVSRFTSFFPYEARIKTLVDGQLEQWPITVEAIGRLAGNNWNPGFVGKPKNFEEAVLATMPRVVYEKFVRGYSEKQWGVPANSLSVALARRFDVRHDNDERLVRHRFQGLPKDGYAAMMKALLKDIHVLADCDYLKLRSEFSARNAIVYTGPIDEYFAFDLGRLDYRSQRRTEEFVPHVQWVQPCAQVNNPDVAGGMHIRSVEWKHLLPTADAAAIPGSVITRETPSTARTPDECEYPFPDSANTRRYMSYRERALAIPSLLVCGRLGEYRYYDMDQAIARARLLAGRLLSADRFSPTLEDQMVFTGGHVP